MTTADRIKNRRLELGLTQLEVAKRLGLTTKAAVSKVEGQGDNVTLKSVEKFAKALDCSPLYLMGWLDDEETYYANDETAQLAQWLYEHEEMRLLFDAAKDVNPDDLKAVHTLLLSLKQKEGGKSE